LRALAESERQIAALRAAIALSQSTLDAAAWTLRSERRGIDLV
jgi:hypothetical protein